MKRSRISDATRLKRGRGLGEFEKYVPFIMTTDFSSKGLRFKWPGVKIKRVHHLLSRLELMVFLTLENSSKVIDIREQYPLLPVQDTVEISSILNIKHPMKNGAPIIRTTDFLVVLETGLMAVSVKPVRLLTERVLELMKIEEVFWERRGIRYLIITDQDVSKLAAKNIKRVNAFVQRPEINMSDWEFIQFVSTFVQDTNMNVHEMLRIMSFELNVSYKSLHHLYLHLLFKKDIEFDFSVESTLNINVKKLCLRLS